NLTLTGTAANATGNSLANVITGNAHDNVLDGGAGADTMIGGAGNDTYVVDSSGDVVTELASEGTDTVVSSVDYTLGANLENLTLVGSALSGTGNAQDNVITGNAHDNVLDGGAGADTMIGGAGNDTYVVDSTGDVVTELASEGTDTVVSSVDYTLGANLENLTLTGTAANATGNSLANVITGNAHDNVLDGGAGADTMIGGAGDDTYFVDSTGDVVTELSGEGTDTVVSSIDYTLGANLENLTLTGGALSGTGNAQDNVITGNAHDNVLDGGAGADTLNGGAGHYTNLDGAGGIDTYDASAASTDLTVDLGAGTYAGFGTGTLANVENATGGAGADHISGSSLDNVLIGNAGDDRLDGGAGADTLIGGAGDDTLFGGHGSDTAVFHGNLADYTIDTATGTITDHVAGRDGTDTFSSIEHFQFADQTLTAPAPHDDLQTTGPSGNLAIDILANDNHTDDSTPLAHGDLTAPIVVSSAPSHGLALVLDDDRVLYVG